MIAIAEHTPAGISAAIVLSPEEGSSSSLIRLLVFVAIFVGPAILKSINESRRKKRESQERLLTRSAPGDDQPDSSSMPTEPESELEVAPSGREQWERLMRGELADEAPAVPPPVPMASSVGQVPPRRILTEARALTEEGSLTASEPLTSARQPELATPQMSLEDPTGYDGVNAPPSRLGREFADFAPQEGLASDRGGGLAQRIGARAAFTGGKAFESLAVQGAQSEVGQREIGGQGFDVAAGQARSPARKRLTRAHLRRAMQLAEILGPPVAVRALDAGPTRPLGWA